MSVDPFASQNNQADPFAATAKEETPKEGFVPEGSQTEGKITATLKQHGGYDAAWVVVHGATASEVKQTLRDVLDEDLLNAVAITASAFADTKQGNQAPPAPPQRSSYQQSNQQPRNQGSSELPPGARPASTCTHNPKPIDGKYGWFWGCGLPQGSNRCKPESIKFDN